MFKYKKLGIPLVDDLLPQGVPVGSVIGITGPPGMGKTIIISICIKAAIKRDEAILYIALDDDPYTVASELESIGIDINKVIDKGKFLVIDCYPSLGISSRLQYPNSIRKAIVISADPSKPSDLLDKLLTIIREYNINKGLLVIDSLNEIITKSDPSRVLDFIKGLRLIARQHEMIGIVAIHTKIPGFEQLEEMLKFTLDGIIELSFDENFAQVGIPLRRIRVVRVKNAPHSLSWIPFTISQRTIMPVDIKELMEHLRKIVAELRTSIPSKLKSEES